MTPHKTVLLLDDDDSVRWTLAALLEEAGYHVVEAESLEAARQAVIHGSIDIALLDIRLRDGMGTDLAEELRMSHPHMPIIMLSGGGPTDQTTSANLVLLKGSRPDEVIGHVQRLLSP